jgi:periplasmic divalent cation tolerance protein
MDQICIVMTTASAPETVQRLIDQALTRKLAACVQVMPIESHYHWQGQIVHDAEKLLLFKAKTSDYPALEELLRAHHDYELPEIVQVPVSAGHPAYIAWVSASTR